MIANKDGGVLPTSSDIDDGSSQVACGDISSRRAGKCRSGRTSDWLLARQNDEGYWVGELEGDTILESEYILLMTFLGRESRRRSASDVPGISRTTSSPDGGWSIYPGGPADVSASVKAYFALKLVGHSPDDPAMVRARAGHPRGRRCPRSATASRGSTWRCWARSAMTSARASRPSWC